MKRKTNDSELPAGELKRIPDFLPPPEQLVTPGQMIRVTLFLRKSSVNFFRRNAQKHHTKYQRMIREVLDRYAGHYQ